MVFEAWQRVRRVFQTIEQRNSTGARGRRGRLTPALEPLEGRQLLTFTGPSAHRTVSAPGGLFSIQVSGPGVIEVFPTGGGAIDLKAFGTTTDTTLSITQIRPRWHFPSQLLSIRRLTVTSGQLGSLDAPGADLIGSVTPLANSVTNLALGELGPGARMTIDGSVGSMTMSTVNLGPTGRFFISGTQNSSVAPSSADVTGSTMIGVMNLNGGRFVIGQDSLAPISILGNLTISRDGLFDVGRDLDGTLSVNGNLELDSGGQIMVGRSLGNLSVGGNVIVNPSGSGVVVGGALGGLTVDGYFQGQGGKSAPTVFDLGVGLNTTGLTILGGNQSLDSLINANIRSGGNISGVNIVYGTVNSTIQPNTPPPA
jgi:hypothetical protein